METKRIRQLKKAVVDQIMLWTVIFVSFVVILFMVVDYSMVMRIQGNLELMTQYSARLISIGKTEDEIATEINGMKMSYFSDITGADIVCNNTVDGSYKVIFNISGLYIDTNILNPRDNITVTSAVFNEFSSDKIECNLALSKQ